MSAGSEINLKSAAELGVRIPYAVPKRFFTAPTEVVSGGAILSQNASVTNLGLQDPCPIIDVANSAGSCYVFETDAQAHLLSTGARARHIEGRAVQQLSF